MIRHSLCGPAAAAEQAHLALRAGRYREPVGGQAWDPPRPLPDGGRIGIRCGPCRTVAALGPPRPDGGPAGVRHCPCRALVSAEPVAVGSEN